MSCEMIGELYGGVPVFQINHSIHVLHTIRVFIYSREGVKVRINLDWLVNNLEIFGKSSKMQG